MNVASEFEITQSNNTYSLMISGQVLCTPNQNPVKHKNKRILEYIQSELECVDELDASVLSMYSLMCTQTEFVESPDFTIKKDDFRSIVLTDPTLKACAGPEKIHQYTKWRILFDYLKDINISYPNLIQLVEPEDIEEWIASNSKAYANEIDKLVDHFYDAFLSLNTAQKVAVINTINVHGSFVYGLLLACKKCNEMEYATAILAGQCVIPEVFADVSKAEYQEELDNLIRDALVISNYLDLNNV